MARSPPACDAVRVVSAVFSPAELVDPDSGSDRLAVPDSLLELAHPLVPMGHHIPSTDTSEQISRRPGGYLTKAAHGDGVMSLA